MDNNFGYDDENCIHNGRRKRLSQDDFDKLIQAFARNPRPTSDERNALSLQLDLNSRSIQIWFQNRRAKLKKESHDPDLFSTKPSTNTLKSHHSYITLPAVSAKNFKEICLPKYLDIPINGQLMSSEDITKNDAIRMFWKEHQNESELTTEMNSTLQYSQPITPPSSVKRSQKRKIVDIEQFQTGFNMPDLLPFTQISGKIGTKMDQNDLSLSEQRIDRMIAEDKLELDTIHMLDLNFLFDSSYKPPDVNTDQIQFSDIFSAFSDI